MVLKSEAVAGAWTIDKISNLRAEKNKKNCELGFELPVKMEQDRNGYVELFNFKLEISNFYVYSYVSHWALWTLKF